MEEEYLVKEILETLSDILNEKDSLKIQKIKEFLDDCKRGDFIC